MSCFSGKIKEYPWISVDCFTKENLASKAFFLSHCHKDHMEGLDSSAFANRIKHSSNIFIYCSETTLNLLLCNPAYIHLKNYLKGIPIDQSYLVSITDEETRQTEALTITLLSAGHCVGSVMFLFEGTNGNVLYTGDFRLSKGDAQRIKFFHSNGCVKDIRSIYVDTTFCLPQMMSIPTRKETKDAIIGVIDKWLCQGPHHMVSLQCKGMYGYEYLLKEIAQHYKTKIHVSKERLALYHHLTDMKQYFTTEPKATKIHSCKWDKKPQSTRSSLPCRFALPNGDVPKVIKIKPTSMWFARHTDPLPADSTRYIKDKKTWQVVHSMHASMEEIIDLVSYLRPYHVYPNVEPAGLYTLEDATNWLKEYTRIDECDSCNQEGSGNANFKVQASEFKISVQQKPNHGKSNMFSSKKRMPSQSVTTAYKELGLEDDSSHAPIPIKRRRRVPNSRSTNTDVSIKMDKDNCSSLTNSDPDSSGRKEESAKTGSNNDSSQFRNLVTVEQIAMKQNTEEVIEGGIIPGIEGEIKVDESLSSLQDIKDLICDANPQNTIKRSCDTGVKNETTEVENSLLQGKQENIRIESYFVGTSLKNEKRIASNSECKDLFILTNDTQLLKTNKKHSSLESKMESSLSSFSRSKLGASSNSGEVFNVPASPGMRVPSKEVLADLHLPKQLENGELSIEPNLFS